MKVSDYTKKQLKKTLAGLSMPVGTRLKSSANKAPKSKQVVDCRLCRYFYVTWQPSTPYGCKAHGFKSALVPSAVVMASSNTACLLFKNKFD